MNRDVSPRLMRGDDLPTLLATALAELSTCDDRLLASWSSLVQVEACFPPLHHGAGSDVLARCVELSDRVEENHQLCSRVLRQLHWACRVDSGAAGTPTLVTETLHTAITHAASLASCLEAAAHTLRTAGRDHGDVVEAASMCRRFLGAAWHDLDRVRADVAQATSLVPTPPCRLHLRAVI